MSGFKDTIAEKLFPRDGPLGHIPIQTYGDGNCLYRATSRKLCGDENMHVELRVRTFIELCINKSQYFSDAFLKQLTGLDNCIDKLFNSSFDTSSVAKNKDKEQRYRESFEAGIPVTKSNVRKKTKYRGSFQYKTTFHPSWTDKWPCIVSCLESKHSFYCTVCKRTVSCGKQGVRDVKVHMETNMHQNNAKGMKNQSTLFQVCASTQNKQDKVRKSVYLFKIF